MQKITIYNREKKYKYIREKTWRQLPMFDQNKDQSICRGQKYYARNTHVSYQVVGIQDLLYCYIFTIASF